MSSTCVCRWSYGGLLALRLIDWLRRDKPNLRLPRTSIRKIRDAFEVLDRSDGSGLDDGVRVFVDSTGDLVMGFGEARLVPLGRGAAQGLAHDAGRDLIEAWAAANGARGPHLSRPGPMLRITPGKLSGEPHVADTRIPTRSLWTLSRRGMAPDVIVELYPRLAPASVEEAIELEDQLERNVRAAA